MSDENQHIQPLAPTATTVMLSPLLTMANQSS